LVDQFDLQIYNQQTGKLDTLWSGVLAKTWTQSRVPVFAAGGNYQFQFFVQTKGDPVSIALDEITFYLKSCKSCKCSEI